jgi:hypothetical protein
MCDLFRMCDNVAVSKICIVLATHNGEMFLEEQLESLLCQTEPNWTLFIRDDHSTDGTRAIIDEYAGHDPRIRVLESTARSRGSARANFAALLQQAFEHGAEYVFCCDQDDVWRPDKLERVLVEFERAEGPGRQPILVHHDLAVVDSQLSPIANSYWTLMALQPCDESRPQRLLSRNEVTGCAMACNRSLLELALPIPEAALMHDWWLALTAGFYGKLAPLSETLVTYRQHGANVIGAKSYRAGLNPLQNWRATWRKGNAEFLDTVRQARAFRKASDQREQLADPLRTALDDYCELPRLSPYRRLARLRRCAVWRHNGLLDAVLVFRMLLLPREGRR